MSKPRLRYSRYVWSCTSYRYVGFCKAPARIGYGYSWRDAYDDWKRQL